MQIIIDISDYNYEWMRNLYSIPEDIKTEIAEKIINGIVLSEPKMGRWIKPSEHTDKNERVYWQCNNCCEYTCAKDYYDKYVFISYCPNCGAKMEGEE